jgi:hypothetical protein
VGWWAVTYGPLPARPAHKHLNVRHIEHLSSRLGVKVLAGPEDEVARLQLAHRGRPQRKAVELVVDKLVSAGEFMKGDGSGGDTC